MKKEKVIAKSIYLNIPIEKENAVYRAGFIGLKHNKTKNQEATLVDRVALLSKNGDFNISEWELFGLEYHKDELTACICGKTNLTNRFILVNVHNHVQISVGSSCLEKHFHLYLGKETLNAMKFAKGSGEKNSWLGEKYNALIFCVLGFKKAMIYFKNRSEKIQANSEVNELLRTKLKISLAYFKSDMCHDRLERGKRLLMYLEGSRSRKQREFLYKKPLSQKKIIYPKSLHSETKSQQIEPPPAVLYKKTAVQDIRMIEILKLETSYLSKDDVRTVNTMVNYYNAHIKYKDEWLSEVQKILHSGRRLDLFTYKHKLYGIAEVQNRFCVYQVVDDDVVFFGYVSTKENAHRAVNLYLEAEKVF